MNDRYTKDSEQIQRLTKEWIQHGKLIVAFDYDNTVFDYHEKGDTYETVISQLQALGKMGCEMICFTSCDESRFDDIRKYLKENNIICHGINKDSDAVPFRGRKIYYNVFYDDRAGLGQVVSIMPRVIADIFLYQKQLVSNRTTEFCPLSRKVFRQGEWQYPSNYYMKFKSECSEEDLETYKIIPNFEDLLPYLK